MDITYWCYVGVIVNFLPSKVVAPRPAVVMAQPQVTYVSPKPCYHVSSYSHHRRRRHGDDVAVAAVAGGAIGALAGAALLGAALR